MANIKLTIEYAGTLYSGWQYQKDEKTYGKILIFEGLSLQVEAMLALKGVSSGASRLMLSQVSSKMSHVEPKWAKVEPKMPP